MKKLILAAALITVFALTACTSAVDTNKALTSAGFTNIEINGYSFFGCGKEDTFRTKFTATNPQGQRVEGVVCSAWFKGATIRF